MGESHTYIAQRSLPWAPASPAVAVSGQCGGSHLWWQCQDNGGPLTRGGNARTMGGISPVVAVPRQWGGLLSTVAVPGQWGGSQLWWQCQHHGRAPSASQHESPLPPMSTTHHRDTFQRHGTHVSPKGKQHQASNRQRAAI